MTWRISRVFGIDTARAASIARRVSSRVTSCWRPDTAIIPREFCEPTCMPEMPTNAERTLRPERRSAASTAAATDWTVRSMSMTTPLRRPSEGACPMPMTSTPPLRPPTSPMSTQTCVVPMSIATSTDWSVTERPPSLTLLLLPTYVRVTARPSLEEMAPDYSDVLEDAPAEREQGHEIEVDPQPVSQEREGGREERVRVEARQEDACIEVPLELGAKRAEERVERGEDADRGVARPLDREVEAQRQSKQHPGDQAEERKPHELLIRAEDDAIGAAHVDVV